MIETPRATAPLQSRVRARDGGGPRVTSIRKIMANRANARESTGPETCVGKARSSRNALRHGFERKEALRIGGLSAEVETLAREQRALTRRRRAMRDFDALRG